MAAPTATIFFESIELSVAAADLWSRLVIQLRASNSLIIMDESEFSTFFIFRVADLDAVRECYQYVTGVTGMFVRDTSAFQVHLGPYEYLITLPLQYIGSQPWDIPIYMRTGIPDNPQLLHTISVAKPEDPLPKIIGPASSTTRLVTPRPMKSNKIPRPPNAFILYRKFHHPMIVQQNPGKHNNEISTIIGKMWGNESPEVIAEFKARAEQANAEHALKYPGYQYQPRKPSEKKRRMTKKKAQAASLLSTKKMIKASRDDSKFIQQDEKVTLSFPLNQDSKKHDVVHNADASPIKDIRSADEPDSNAFGFIDPTLFTNITAAPEAPDCTRLDASAPYFSDIEGIFHPSTYENYSAPEPYPENGEPDVLTLISRQMGWIS